MKLRILFVLVAAASLWACQPEINEFEPTKGSADFSVYMSAGNSLTAGYAGGALYRSGQENSYTAILAKQFEAVGRQGAFKIPYINTEDGIGIQGATLRTKLVMGYSTDCQGNTSLAPVPANPNASQQELAILLGTSVAADGPFHNIGVAGAKITHLLAPGYASLNPFYARFASDPANAVINEIGQIQPTFFTLWIGNNDVLTFALAGGAADEITAVETFAASLEAIIMTFKASATAGAIANIPNITDIPYFTTVPYNPIVLQDQTLVDQLNAGYAQYNAAMEQFGLPHRISFTMGANPMVIQDPTIPTPPGYEMLRFRQISEAELVLLSIPQDSLKCGFWGSMKPVPGQFVLTMDEKSEIEAAIIAYNQIIESAAQNNDLALVDMNSVLKQGSTTGIKMDGVLFTADFVTGNAFSTDGVHLTPQGNALAANTFIDAINKKYNARVPKVNVADYEAVRLP